MSPGSFHRIDCALLRCADGVPRLQRAQRSTTDLKSRNASGLRVGKRSSIGNDAILDARAV